MSFTYRTHYVTLIASTSAKSVRDGAKFAWVSELRLVTSLRHIGSRMGRSSHCGRADRDRFEFISGEKSK